MVLATVNKFRQLLSLTYIGDITLKELQGAKGEVESLLGELSPGFQLLADFSRLDSMDLDCAEEIGRVMEVMDRRGVSLLVRVIPDPSKDIGMNILTRLHYRNHPKVVACQNLAEAALVLGISSEAKGRDPVQS